MRDLLTRLLWSGVFSCCSLLLVGCGPNLGQPTSVSGTVTVDDQPFASAPIAFHAVGEVPAEFRTFTAMTDSGGQYKIETIYPGKYEVIVVDSGSSPEAGSTENVVAGNPLQPADGKKLEVTISTEPAEFDIALKRVQ